MACQVNRQRMRSSFEGQRQKSNIGLSLGNGPDAGVGPLRIGLLWRRATVGWQKCTLAYLGL